MELALSVAAGLATGTALVITLAIFFPYVDPNAGDEQKVWMAYTPIQCKDKPWSSVDYSEMPEEYRQGLIAHAYGAAKYYEGQGIVVYNSTVVGGNHVVPAACGFNSGYDVFLQVPKVQVIRMLLAGFRVKDLPLQAERENLIDPCGVYCTND